MGNARTPRVLLGILLCVTITNSIGLQIRLKSGLACTDRLTVSQTNDRKRIVVKVLLPFLENSTQLGCVFQDSEPPKSHAIFRKGTKSFGWKRSVRFSKGTSHRKKSRSRGVIQKRDPQEQSSCVKIRGKNTGRKHGIRRKMTTSTRTRIRPWTSRLRMFGVYECQPQRNQRKDNLWWILEHQCTC